MRCPFCSCAETRVVDSRAADEGDQTRRRRRECTECKERFTTYEAAELNPPRIIKSDGRREDFDEEKLLTGLRRALGKRPVGEEKVRAAVAHVMHRLRALGDREVKSGKIGELVMRELRDLDHVAYVR
ncbi:MAG: transcriptional regulator NrdR, partial [Gammaproteobacteria bacterium]